MSLVRGESLHVARVMLWVVSVGWGTFRPCARAQERGWMVNLTLSGAPIVPFCIPSPCWVLDCLGAIQLKKVKHVVELSKNDSLPLDYASQLCNSDILSRCTHFIAFAFHDSDVMYVAHWIIELHLWFSIFRRPTLMCSQRWESDGSD